MGSDDLRLKCALLDEVDAATGCRLPRRCRACANLEGCAVGVSGGCGDVTGGPLPVAPEPSSRVWPLIKSRKRAFNSTDVSYCAADDPICSLCRSMFEDHSHRIDRVYGRKSVRDDVIEPLMCLGRSNCICLEACEIDWWRRSISILWQHNCSSKEFRDRQSTVAPFVRPTSLSHPRVAPGDQRPAPDTCEYAGRRPDARGYRPPRPCIDCLKREDCMIDYDGYCVNRTLNGFDRWTGWQRAIEAQYEGNTSVPWNTTVCSSADPQCRRCLLDAWQRHANGSEPQFPPTTCRGWNGCACALQCNAPDDLTAFYEYLPNDLTRVFSVERDTTVAIVVGFTCLTFMLVRWLQRFAEVAQATVRAARAAARRILPERALDLFGWQALRRELIARELQLLAGAETVEPVVLPPVNLLLTAPSAPDQALLDIEDGVESPKAPVFVHPHDDASAPHSEDELTASKLIEQREHA